MKVALGYPFYVFDDDETPLVPRPRLRYDLAQKYNLKLAKLAWDLANLIKKLEAAAPSPDPHLVQTSRLPRRVQFRLPRGAAIPGIPISACTATPVLPDRPLLRSQADRQTAVDALLAQSKLSIHLVGAHYGAVPDGPSEKSVVILQNEPAIQHAKSGRLQRVIWGGGLPEENRIPVSAPAVIPRRPSPRRRSLPGADLITGDLEKLRAAALAVLQKLEKPDPPKAEPANSVPPAPPSST